MRRCTFLVMWLVGILAASCSAGGPPAGEEEHAPADLFIGALEGSDAKIALLRDDGAWAAYVCGGASTLSSLTGWFQGDLAPGFRGAVGARSDGKELAATFDGKGATGTLIANGTDRIRFEASLVSPRAPGGLYQSFSNGCRTGLIVPPSGAGEPQGVYCADLSLSDERVRLFEQVTPVAPITPGDDIVAARVLDASAQIIHLEKVALPLDSS